MYNINLQVYYKCGGWSIDFKKTIESPFTPFYGLNILVNRKTEHFIRLVDNDYQNTAIIWDDEYKDFDIIITHYWMPGITDTSVVDDALEVHKDWLRTDNTDINKFKSILNRNND